MATTRNPKVPAQQSRTRPKAAAAATSIDFQLHFTGLCAFVPYVDAAGISKMRAVLVDVESPDALARAMDDAIHTPALLVPQVHLKSTTLKAPLMFDGTENGYGGMTALFLLRRNRLSIPALGAKDIGPVAGLPVDCPPMAMPSAFAWVRDMPAPSNVMTMADFDTSDDDVIARMDLYDGTLFTSAFPFSLPKRQVLLRWYWDDDKGSQGIGTQTPRAIAEEITFGRQWTNLSEVTLKVDSDSIVLQPQSGAIDVWLVNLPLIDILVDRSQWSSQQRKEEHHFHNYHRLAVTPGSLIPWPDLDPTHTCPPPTGDVANPRCPPAYFAGGVQ